MREKLLSLLRVVGVLFLLSGCNDATDNNTDGESADLQSTIDDLEQQVDELETDLAEQEEQLSEQNEENGNDETVADDERLRERADGVVITLEG